MTFKYFLFLMLSAACSCHLNVAPPTCEQKAIYKSHLSLALDMIKRAKYNLSKDRIPKALDCADVLQMGGNKSGIYEIWPMSRLTDGNKPVNVYCDMETNGGGWTVIQRRGDFQQPRDYFNQDWENYKNGFGDINEDFWLGNDNIFALTNQKHYSVRFDLRDVEENKRYAVYDKFWIDDEEHNYDLHILDYCGDAEYSVPFKSLCAETVLRLPNLYLGSDPETENFGDRMRLHNNQAFSTKDKDNDKDTERHCGAKFKGGWWYGFCFNANLNGLYIKEKSKEDGFGVIWADMNGGDESMEWTEIKIRPKDFTPAASDVTCKPHNNI